jgi:uncharacterized protein (DUF4415 family)
VTTKQFTVQRSRNQLDRMEDYSLENPPSQESLGAGFWREAVPLYPSRNRKLARLRLDPEILDWFGTQREDSHAGVNAVLRAYIERRRADGQETA